MSLFAQSAVNNPGGFAPGDAVFLIVLCCFLAVALTIGICFLVTMSIALGRCHPRNRTMEPGMVWLNLVPCLNIVWQFITVSKVSESLKNEFESRRWYQDGDYGKSIGIAACAVGFAGAIPLIGGIFGLVSLVLRIVYWVKIAGYSAKLASDGPFEDDDDRRDRRFRDDEDDRFRSRDRRDPDEGDRRPRREAYDDRDRRRDDPGEPDDRIRPSRRDDY